jgi:hypothetical protein
MCDEIPEIELQFTYPPEGVTPRKLKLNRDWKIEYAGSTLVHPKGIERELIAQLNGEEYEPDGTEEPGMVIYHYDKDNKKLNQHEDTQEELDACPICEGEFPM